MEPVAIAAVVSICVVGSFLIWSCTRNTRKPTMIPMIKSPSREALNAMIAQNQEDPTPVASSV